MRNETHDPSLRSWVDTANSGSDFPLQNLPFGSFRRAGSPESFRGGVAIGDQVLDLDALELSGALKTDDVRVDRALAAASCAPLNEFMATGPDHWSALRLALSRALRVGAAEQAQVQGCLVPMRETEMALPARIGDFTDFYTSIHHATTVGLMFRPDNPLMPNYKWLPVGYHGRSSSVTLSGHDIVRPCGQKPTSAATPVFGPSARLDYELELGVFVGPGNTLGSPIPIAEAESHVFGLCVLNDWSARDLQAWEYQPLGPFLAKNFGTTISPWVVTLEALAPFRLPWTRAGSDPQPLPYLEDAQLRRAGALDIQLEVSLETAQMRRQGVAPARLSRSNYRDAYWSVSQLLAHHTINGCNLQPGDLLGTGTLSGPEPEAAGSLLELSAGGKRPVPLPDGEQRTFLEDGDRVIMRAWCERAGAVRIGFGSASARILPARTV